MRLHRKYLISLGFLLVLSVLCPLLTAPLSNAGSPGAFLLYAQGGAIYNPDVFIPALIFGSLPLLAFLYLFSDFLKSDLDGVAVYLFTRKNNRSTWLVKKAVQLCLCTLLLYTVTYAVLVCFYLIFHGGFGAAETLYQAAALFFPVVVTNSLSTCFLILLVNTVSLKTGSLGAFCTVAALHFFCIFVCMALSALPTGIPGPIAHLMPSAQGIFLWHEMPAFLSDYSGELFGQSVTAGFSLVHSLAYLAILIPITGLIGSRLVQRIDLM